MGQIAGRELKHPVKDIEQESASHNGMSVVSSAMQGWRKQMEDAHFAEFNSFGPNTGLFFVFDGHGGAGLARQAAKTLPAFVKRALQSFAHAPSNKQVATQIISGCQQAFRDLDASLRSQNFSYRLEGDLEDPGSVVVGVAVLEHMYVFLNLGDSRGFLADKSGVSFETIDHKPSSPKERDRIEKAGGFVASDRVCRCLGVSRALGDFMFKDQQYSVDEYMVSPVPDVFVRHRRPDIDEFICLACDGVFDVMTTENVEKFIRQQLLEQPKVSDVGSRLLNSCLRKGSTDNMSCILLCLPGALRQEKVDDMIDNLFAGLDDEDPQESTTTKRVSYVANEGSVYGDESVV